MQYIRIKLIAILVTIVGFLPGIPELRGQEVPELFVAVEDTDVHIYHLELLSPGHGFNIYRRMAGERNYVRLNETVVRGARRGSELPSFLGNRYQEVRRQLDQPNASAMFSMLRSSPFLHEVYTMTYPEVARALGRVYVDTDAPVGERVEYRVAFTDSRGMETGATLQREILLQETALLPPHDLRAKNKGREVTLTWQYPAASRSDPDNVTHFNVYRQDPATGQLSRINDHVILREMEEATSLTFMARNVGKEEHYAVSAVRMTGTESPPSDILDHFVEDNVPPPAVSSTNARWLDNGHVEVTWTPVADPVIGGYHVYRSENISEGFERITPEMLGPSIALFTDRNVPAGREYFYSIKTISRSGMEGDKSAVAVVFVYDFTPPPGLIDMEAHYLEEEDQVLLRWSTADGSIPDEVASYVVYRREKDSDIPTYALVSTEPLLSLELVDLGIADAGFDEGTTYQYAAYAIDKFRNISDTVYAQVHVPKVTPPDPPSGVSALNDNARRINLYWNAPLSLDVHTYQVFRKIAGDAAFVHIATKAADQRMLRDEEVTTGNTYVYTVRAVDDVGNASVEAAPDTLFFRNKTPPRDVRGLQAVYTDEGVILQWGAVEGVNMAGYIVQRSGMPTGQFDRIHPGLLEDTETLDPDGTPENWYRVRAIDTSGNKSRPGAPVRPAVRNN